MLSPRIRPYPAGETPMVLSFLKCVARVVLKAGVNVVTLGVGGGLVDEIWDEWGGQTEAEQRGQELGALARLGPKQARQQAVVAVGEAPAGQAPELELLLTTYLAQ